MSLRVVLATSPTMSCAARVGVEVVRRATALSHGTCGLNRTKCPECPGPARQQPPCSPVHTPLTAQCGNRASTGHYVYILLRQPLKRPVSHIDERVPYGSGRQPAECQGQPASLKKAVCEASLWIPLISFAARVSTAVMLAPCSAESHSSMPLVMHGAMRDRRTSSSVDAQKYCLRRTGSH